MTHINFNFLALVALLIFSACDSDDDAPTIDRQLLLGQWFRTGLCFTQNSITFNEDGSYVRTASSNEDCDENLNDTYQYTGTYSVSGITLNLNQQTETIIEIGTANLPTQSANVALARQNITLLTENKLVIEEQYTDADGGSDIVFTQGLSYEK